MIINWLIIRNFFHCSNFSIGLELIVSNKLVPFVVTEFKFTVDTFAPGCHMRRYVALPYNTPN